MGLFGGSSSVSSASGQSASGLGAFTPENYISIGQPFFDLNIRKPSQIIGLTVVLAAAWYGYKRYLKK